MSIPARISLVTLGVDDFERATAFYRALGWERSDASTEEISFFRTAGAVLALYPRSQLSAEAGLPPEPGDSFAGTTLAVNVERPEQVAQCLDAAVAAGARLLKHATRADWGGTSGYFADPDGFVWEVAHNPFFPIADDGTVTLP